MRRLTTYLALLFLVLRAQAQDIHFTQFWQTALYTNPSQVGIYDGAHRIAAVHKNQWRSVTTPYSTFGLSYDASQITLPARWRKEDDVPVRLTPWSIGAQFYYDQAGDSRMRSNQLLLTVGRRFDMGSFVIQPAVTWGLSGMRLDYSALNFDTQWNGLYFDPSAPNAENFSRMSMRWMDVSGGLVVGQLRDVRRPWKIGMAVFNITEGKQSFYSDATVQLNRRWTMQYNQSFPIGTRWRIDALLQAQRQGVYREINPGALVHFVTASKPWYKESFYAGIIARIGDAGCAVVGIESGPWNVGLSYDVNVSPLKIASKGRGSLE
ncbi:MAG: PorP/SprF family type IX secretion system membrane protein, partial [Flavobacteriales bacterium]